MPQLLNKGNKLLCINNGCHELCARRIFVFKGKMMTLRLGKQLQQKWTEQSFTVSCSDSMVEVEKKQYF